MSAGPLVTHVVLTFCLALGILYKYGNLKKQNALVTLAVLIAWYFSFLIIFVLPLDVSSTVFRQCLQDTLHIDQRLQIYFNSSVPANTSSNLSTCDEPWSNVPEDVFPNLWRIVYWTSQVLTWLILPLMQSYARAGEFNVQGKLKSALVDNAIYYGSYLFICGILFIYLAFKPGLELDGQKLKAIASSASNTWGLFLLVGLLGYALVEIPRNFWNSSKGGYRLQQAYFKVAKVSSDRCEAEEGLDEVLEQIHAMRDCIRPRDPLYSQLEVVLNKIPLSLNQKNRHSGSDAMVTPTLKSLVRIHKSLIKALHTSKRCETQWELAVERVILLEDVQRNRLSHDHTFKHTFPNTPSLVSPSFEWWWRCWVQDYVLKGAAVVTAIMSAAVVWSELTFFNQSPTLSFFALLFDYARETYDYFAIEVLSTLTIAYLCFCAYSTVLKIRVLNYYYLAPHHQTDEHSLIFSGMMLCRLTPPMCLNFLSLIHMDSYIIKTPIKETYYTQVMGHMNVVSIISDGFNIYFPMAVLAFCLATYFSVGSRILSLIGFQQFLDHDTLTSELVDEGRELVNREKRRRQRTEESAGRRREYHERFSTRPDRMAGGGLPSQAEAEPLLGSNSSLTGTNHFAARPHSGYLVAGVLKRDNSSRSNLLADAAPIATSDEPINFSRIGYQPPTGIFDDI